MSFGQLVPGMQPMPVPQMQPNQMMKMGMAAIQQARGMQRPGQPGQQGLLQRLLNPTTPPTDLGAPGMAPNADPSQMGMLAKLFPALAGNSSMGGMMPQAPQNILGSGPY